MTEPVAIDGSTGPLVARRIVVWRRLEPGDVRTPGTELAPESTHLEAKIIEVGIARSLHDDLARIQAKRDATASRATGLSTRYEPAGVLLTIGGSLAVGAWLDYLPDVVLPVAGSLVVLAFAVGAFTKANKKRREVEADRAWRVTEERGERERIEKRLAPRWERFATKLREDTGFRAEVRVGDIHEADRLVSIDVERITHPDTWTPDPKPNDVRYGWRYADGRIVEQKAELEDTDDVAEEAPEPAAKHATDTARADEESDDDASDDDERDDDERDDASDDDERDDEASDDGGEADDDEEAGGDEAPARAKRARD
jgi:hypothetical protein